MKKIAKSIPHDYRRKILLEWLPVAVARMDNVAFRNLFNAYYIYVEPDAVPKEGCPRCLQNVLDNWRRLQGDLIEVEKEYNLIERL